MAVSYNFYQRVAIGITTGLFALTTFVVFMRLYIRCILLKAGSAGWDDLTVFIAWIMALGATIATYFEVKSGLGRHVEELTADQMYNFGLSLFIVIQFYNVGLNTVKISFLSQYHRLFPDPLIRRICFCFGTFCFVWMFAQAVLYAFSCVPITALVPGMSVVCVPTLPTWTAISSLNVFSDLLIFCIPLKPLWGMPLLKRQRYLLIGIFCVGFLVCIISIIRIPTLRRGAASTDPTFTNVTTALWSLAELDTAILCTSLPILRPLVARFMRGVAPADAPVDRLRAGAERPAEEPGPRKSHKLPGESLLYDTGLSGSTLQSGGKSFLRSLISSGTGTRNADRDRDAEAGNDDAANNKGTTTVVELFVPKGSFERPADTPLGGLPRSEPPEKLVPRSPVTFYSRAYRSTNESPVTSVPPMRAREPRGLPSPSPVMNIANTPLHAIDKPPYHTSTTILTSDRRPASADDASPLSLRPPTSPLDALASPLPRVAPPRAPILNSKEDDHPQARRYHIPSPPPRLSPFPRSDSFTLQRTTSPSTPQPAQQQRPPQYLFYPPTTHHICSRCASLSPWPLPRTMSAEDTRVPQRGVTWRDDDEQVSVLHATRPATADRPSASGRAWGGAPPMRSMQTQTQTFASWDPFVGVGDQRGVDRRLASAQGVREEEREEEEEEEQNAGEMESEVEGRIAVAQATGRKSEGLVHSGRVSSGQGVRVVDVRTGDKPRSWRAQVVLDDAERGQGRQQSQTPEVQEQVYGVDDNSSVEEILPRGRRVVDVAVGEASARPGAPRRSTSLRRGAGTSWLRLSMG